MTVASVAKKLLSLLKTGHEVVFSSGKSYIPDGGEEWGELRPLSLRCGVEAPAAA